MRFGTEVLAAERPALNRFGEGSSPSGPTPMLHWSSSGEDSALVTRGRGFESHPVLSALFDNSATVKSAHDVAVAYRLAMADVRVRLPLGTYRMETTRDVGKPGQSACFGSRRAPVRIRPSRLADATIPVEFVLVRAPGC